MNKRIRWQIKQGQPIPKLPQFQDQSLPAIFYGGPMDGHSEMVERSSDAISFLDADRIRYARYWRDYSAMPALVYRFGGYYASAL